MVSILHKRIYRHLSRVLLLAIVICVSFPALAVFTGTGTISNPNPSPGELVSVNWVLTESDDTGGTFPVHSPSEISIFEPIFPLGTQPPVSIIGSIIPPGIVGDLGPIPPGPNFLTHNEVNILIPPGIAPGSYLLNRDWEGPGGNVAGGVSAAFTIGAGDPATPPELEPVVVDVSGTAIPDSVDQGSIHTVQIEWSFNLTTNLAQNIASNSGLLDDEIVNGPLNSFNYLSGQRLTESLLITREQIDQAITNDESQLVYMREFTVNNEITVVGSVLIDIDGGLLSTVSASSASSTLQVDRSHTIFVNWLATLQRVGLGTSRNITSNRGEFLLPDGTRLGAGVANSLSQSTVSTALFNESVTIGRSVLLQGVQANANQIIYRREFTDGIVTVEAMVTFQLVASGSSGELFIPYLGLSFADGSVQKVVRSGEAPTAIAEITTQGIGSLEGYWEVAVPPSTLGQPIFTPVKFVQSQLAGSTIHRETSPVLPIASEGLYLVRFRLTRPQINQDMPQILYVVKGGNAPKPITILDPKPGVPVTHKTVFQWQGIPSSVAYKLEIFAWPRSSVDQLVFPGENVCRELDRSELSDRPIAGIFVRATETAASLGDLVLEQLQNSTIDRRIFCYHVAAIDGSGRRIGLSALETIIILGDSASEILQGTALSKPTSTPKSCVSDADCTDAAKPMCIIGICSAIPFKCSVDSDCQDPSKPKCDVTNKQCTSIRDQGAVTFVKSVGGANPADWTFDVVNGPQNIAHGNSVVLNTGSYTITENGPSGYSITGASGICSLSNNVITLNVGSKGGTCTITNTRDPGKVVFTKSVSSGSSVPADWSFNIVGGQQNIGHGNSVSISAGSYTVTENGPSGYSITGASGICSLSNNVVTLNVGNNGGTCTITNSRDTGKVIFTKSVSGGSSAPADWSFSVVDGPQNIAHGNSVVLNTGSYTITENGPSGYSITGASGICSLSNNVITLNVGSKGGTCTITNTRDPGKVVFTKSVSSGSSVPADWSFNIVGGQQNIGHGNSVSISAGSYTVTENGPSGYSITGASGICSLSNNVVTLNVGNNGGTCTITNSRDTGKVIFTKSVSGGSSAPADWSFSVVDGPQNIAHGNSVVLNTGSYTITETGPLGYSITAASGICSLSNNVVTLNVDSKGGTCTITNTRDPGKVVFTKSVSSGSSVPSDWSFNIVGGQQNIGHGNSVSISAGNYTVTENGPTEYSITGASGLCSLNNNVVTLNVGSNGGTCTITNSRDTGKVIFTKSVSDGSSVPADWNFSVVDGPQNIAHGNSVVLNTGSYTITETGPLGYSITAASGICSLSNNVVTLNVDSKGGTCTITNTRDPGKVVFTKPSGPSVPADSTFGVTIPPINDAGEISIDPLVFHGQGKSPATSGKILVPPIAHNATVDIKKLEFFGKGANTNGDSDVIIPPVNNNAEISIDEIIFFGKKAQECFQPVDKGPCQAVLPRWYFDHTVGKCLPYNYGGCGGNTNNFLSKVACETTCTSSFSSSSLSSLQGENQFVGGVANEPKSETSQPVQDIGLGRPQNSNLIESIVFTTGPSLLSTSNTQLGWKSVSGADNYKLEIYAWPRQGVTVLGQSNINICSDLNDNELSGQPIVEENVKSTKSTIDLSTITLNKLQTQSSNNDIYCYHVVAINSTGSRIAKSPWNTLHLGSKPNKQPEYERAPETSQAPDTKCKETSNVRAAAAQQGSVSSKLDCQKTYTAQTQRTGTAFKDDILDKGVEVKIDRFEPANDPYMNTQSAHIESEWSYAQSVKLFIIENGVPRLLKTLKSSPANQSIDLGQLTKGIYSYKLEVTGPPPHLKGVRKTLTKFTTVNIVDSITIATDALKWSGENVKVISADAIKLIGTGVRFKKITPQDLTLAGFLPTKTIHADAIKLIGTGIRSKKITPQDLTLAGFLPTKTIHADAIKLIGTGIRSKKITPQDLTLAGFLPTKTIHADAIKLIGTGIRSKKITPQDLTLAGFLPTKTIHADAIKLIGTGIRSKKITAQDLTLAGFLPTKTIHSDAIKLTGKSSFLENKIHSTTGPKTIDRILFPPSDRR